MATYPITKRGAEMLKAELHKLKTVERPAVIQAISEARAQGDLSENADYDAAKERQGLVNARLNQLKQRLAEMSMIDFSKIPRDKVGLGSEVVLLDLNSGEEVTYKLVTTEEADAAKGRISTSSPIGRGLLGKEAGDTVKIRTPGGVKEFEIRKLTTIHDATERI